MYYYYLITRHISACKLQSKWKKLRSIWTYIIPESIDSSQKYIIRINFFKSISVSQIVIFRFAPQNEHSFAITTLFTPLALEIVSLADFQMDIFHFHVKPARRVSF